MPCEAYPWLFPKGTLFDKYPFLLPNLVCVVVLTFGIANGLLFLEETHANMKDRRDIGLELGDYLVEKMLGIQRNRSYHDKSRTPIPNELDGLTMEDPPPGYRSTEGSPRLCSTPATSIVLDPETALSEKAPRGCLVAFNRQVLLIIIGYAILA